MSLSLHDTSARSAQGWRNWRFVEFLENWTWRYRSIVWILVCAFYLLSFNGLWRIGSDSALYMSVARSIARGEGYLYHGEIHRIAYPGLPYLLAGLMKIAPDHFILIGNFIMLCCALAILVLCYRLFRLIVVPQVALIAMVMVAVNVHIYELAFELLTDLPFMMGSLMVLLGGALTGLLPVPRLDPSADVPTARGKRVGWLLLVTGLMLAAVMRPTFYVLAIGVVVGVLVNALKMRRLRHMLSFLALAALVVGLLFVITRYDPRRATQSRDVYEMAVADYAQKAIHNWRLPLQNLLTLISPDLPNAYFGFSWGTYGDPIIVPILMGVTGWVLWRWPMAILWIVGTLALQCIVQPLPRYMIPIIPLLALAWWYAAKRLSQRLSPGWANTLALAAFLLMVPNACRCVGQIWFDQYRRPFIATYHRGTYAAVTEIAPEIAQHIPPQGTLISPAKTDRILTYLADRDVIAVLEPGIGRYVGRPLWILIGEQDNAGLDDLRNRGFKLGPPIARSRSTYRRTGVLQLHKATWPATAPR